MMAEIVVIGTELLLGRHFDQNSLFLTDALAQLGIQPHFKTVVGDQEGDLEEALRTSLSRSNLVVTTGGLGPTADDITRKVVARVMQRRLVFREELLPQILRIGSAGAERIPKSAERQALIPSRSTVIPNPIGTAPGFLLTEEGKTVISLPGVPEEMRRMFEQTVGPWLTKSLKTERTLWTRILRTCGMPESAVDERLRDLFRPRGRATIGLSAKPVGVDILIWVAAGSGQEASIILSELDEAIRHRLGPAIYGVDQQTLEEVVGGLLQKSGRTIALAESCTGGLVGHRLTNIPGSSTFFDRSLVCYSNRAKTELLGVSEEILQSHGAVSAETARSMAEGIRDRAGTDLGLAVTGIAGPAGGSPEKPVGLVYMALAHGAGTNGSVYRFKGEREAIKAQAAQMALDLLRRHLLNL